VGLLSFNICSLPYTYAYTPYSIYIHEQVDRMTQLLSHVRLSVHLCVRSSTRHSTAAVAVLEFTTVRTIPLTKERRDYFNVVPNGDSDMLAPAVNNKMNTTVVSVFFSGEIWRCAITLSPPHTYTHLHTPIHLYTQTRARAHHLHGGAGTCFIVHFVK